MLLLLLLAVDVVFMQFVSVPLALLLTFAIGAAGAVDVHLVRRPMRLR